MLIVINKSSEILSCTNQVHISAVNCCLLIIFMFFEKGTSFRIINITVFFVHNNATVKQLPHANVTGLHKKFTENRTFRYCKDSFI